MISAVLQKLEQIGAVPLTWHGPVRVSPTTEERRDQMKFGMFTLGPVPKSAEKDAWDEDQELNSYQNWLDQMEAADRQGYDYLFIGEHHNQTEYCHIPEPETFLAAVSQRTRRARLGTTIAHISTTDSHPVRVAERATMLDLLSNGRWELGTGPVGNHDGPHNFDLSDAERQTINEHSADIWEEGLREIVRMMTEEPYGGTNGEFFNIAPFTLVPRPAQKPHPPLWKAALTAESNARTARLGLGALNMSETDLEAVREMVAAYWDGLRQGISPIGKAINAATAMYVPVHCARTDAEAEARGRHSVDFFSYALTRNRRDHSQVHHLTRGVDELLATTGRDGLRMNLNRSALIGSPETIAPRLREYEATNVDMVVFVHVLGETSHEALMESQELLATKVMPEFRERQEAHERWREERLEGIEGLINATV